MNAKPQDINAEVLYNSKISKHYFNLGLKTGWSNFDPGQFVMVRVPGNVVFLRRPFSICRKIDRDTIELFYKVVGPGTTRLSELISGDKVQVLGPLGRGFSIPKGLKKAVMVAGGFGIAPFVTLAAQISKKKIPIDLYYGGKGLEDIQFLDEFEEMGVECHISTEDGSLGTEGMVTELLLKNIDNYSNNNIIYSCGPEGMTEAVVGIAKEHSMPAQVSYETYMGCGMGVCLGCAVKTKDGYKRAGTEGPVFDIKEIV